jgi:hypothetical protein
MTSNLIPLPVRGNMPPTYGAGGRSDVGPLEAMLEEVQRTHATILWLEAYVGRLPEWRVFTDTEVTWDNESELTRGGKPTPEPGSIRYLVQVERQRQLNGGKTRAAIHPAVTQLLRERQHLVQTCAVAIKIGVALDAIEMAKTHGAQLLEAMRNFAIAAGHDVDDPEVLKMMASALDKVSA